MINVTCDNLWTIGYAYVVGDIIHEGHLLHLENCKALCDKLIVGVLTDKAVMEMKAAPAIPFEERIQIIKSLGCVDAAVTQDKYSPLINVLELRPDILFESTSHEKEELPGFRGRVIYLPYYPSESSTNIKERIKDA